MATIPKYFSDSGRVVSHRISSSSSMKSPSNPKRTVSTTNPAPLAIGTGCASCRKRKAKG